MNVLIPEFMDAPAVERLKKSHTVIYDPNLVDDMPRLLEMARSCDAIIVRNRTQVRGELLSALERCLVVGRLGVGLDNIDMEECKRRDISVFPAYGANANSVAEYVIASAMFLLRGCYTSTADVAAGNWPRTALSQGRELAGRTLGLAGFGSIGQLTARLGKALGMQVIAYDPVVKAGDIAYTEGGVKAVSLDELVATADVLSLHMPLVDATRNLFDQARIASMKQGAILVNTARGGIVDEAAVAAALRSGHLSGAAIDVFAEEPLKASAHFIGCPNLILTPHVGGLTVESNERVSGLVAGKVLEALAELAPA
ncbi:hydroxyacid dehydrogenase [Comamonas testosteroni]|uniref:hydroxyacid dehydrogenase n=1 Tax=Comamonas testosteroni TaxID=285 RepID=UPI00389B300A